MDNYIEERIEDLYKGIIAFVQDMASAAPDKPEIINKRLERMYSVVNGYKRHLITEYDAFDEIKKIYMGF